jgi:hypothetical protein
VEVCKGDETGAGGVRGNGKCHSVTRYSLQHTKLLGYNDLQETIMFGKQ